MNLFTFISSYIYPQKIGSADSKINGNISVQKFFGRNRIIAGGLTQSGEYVEDLFERAVKKFESKFAKPESILILGLGGGSVISVINKFFPGAQIVGVEIDPKMVDLGKKYLQLDRAKNLNIVIDDASQYVKGELRGRFDLILNDCYLGYNTPAALESKDFLANVYRLLSKNGIFVSNRLFFGSYKSKTNDFLTELKSIFPHLEQQKVYSNLLIFAGTV